MRGTDHHSHSHARPWLVRRYLAVASLLVAGLLTSSVTSTTAATLPLRIDLRVLVLDDGSPWVDGIASEMQVEGVPYTAVALGSPSRQPITDAFLASGDRAFYQAVVAPDYLISTLTAAERTSLRAFEAKFGVREVDGFNWPNPAVGLDYPGVIGDINGTTATVTPAGLAGGFGYLNGPVPFSAGSYSYVAEPLPAASQVAGANFTTLVGAPLPNGATGSLVGVYSNAGVDQMVITAAFSFTLPQFKTLAHGIITWATRGVHFGYNRNNLTFNVDDAFSSISTWNSTLNCTPGEDCTGAQETTVRMTPDDVTAAVNWEQANNYQLTLAFNSAYAYVDNAPDPLADALRANAASFRWLNHGAEHIYQGCVQDFSVQPWACTVDANGQTVWVSQQAIYDEITNNIVNGQALGLSFDPTEYLSGEHSGLFLLPQQPTDNPNFAAALTQAGILHIGSDASRDNGARQVGSATTIPRHPTALYYNTATQADAVDEYNWLYNSRANGGSGYCEDNPATATCIQPLDPATGFTAYIVPTDAAYDMGFVLGNDPRPFYAHTSNMTGDRLLYPLLDTILGTYRAAFTPATPLVNNTLTQASTQLDLQTKWAATGTSAVTGFIQSGHITVLNTAGVSVPITAPVGTTITGATLQPYGGEVSAWLNPGSTTGNLATTSISITGSTSFAIGRSGAVNIAATGVPAPTVSLSGALPTGLAVSVAPGAATIAGTPLAGTAGSYPLTITVVSGTSTRTQGIVITVSQPPQFTSATSATAVAGTPFSFTVAAAGTPTPSISRSGRLPSGITYAVNAGGTATLSGTAAAASVGQTYPITFTATNSGGTARQTFTLTVAGPPAFTGATLALASVNRSFTFTVQTTANPIATITATGRLPAGVTFVDRHDGTARLSGTPARGTTGLYNVVVTAQNSYGTATRTITLLVR